MSDEDELSKILLFPVRDDDVQELAGYIYESGTRCGHPAIRVIEQERRCVCRKCGAVLDPFDYLLSMAITDYVVVEEYKAATGETITEAQAATALINCQLLSPERVTCAEVIEYLKVNKPAQPLTSHTPVSSNSAFPVADIRAMGLRDLTSYLDAEKSLVWREKVYTRAYMVRKINNELADVPDDLSRAEKIHFAEESLDAVWRSKLITGEEFCTLYRMIREDGVKPLVVLGNVRDALLNGTPVIPGTL